MTTQRGRTRWAGPFFALGTLVLAIGALHFAAPLLIPIGVAVLLAFVLSPFVRWLERHGAPRLLASAIAVLGVVIAVTGLGWTVAHQANQLLDTFPQYEDNLRRKLKLLRTEDGNILSKLRDVARKVDKEISGETMVRPPSSGDAVKVTVVNAEPDLTLANLPSIASSAAPALGGSVLCLALLGFMLMRREDLRERIFGLVGRSRMPITTRALDETWERITRTLLAQFTINASFGLAYGLGMYLIGIPFAVLWGLLAILLRYVPFVGSTISFALPFAVSVLMMQGWEGPLLVLGWFCAVALAMMGVEAWLIGTGIGVSPAATLVMLGFWTWLWGPIALILATPLTACLMVVARFLPQFRFLEVALGDQPVLDAPARLYQRLLSGDAEEARRLFDQRVRSDGSVAACDDLLRPAVVLAAADRAGQRITAREYGDVVDGAAVLVDSDPVVAEEGDTEAAFVARNKSEPQLRGLCIARDHLDRVGFLMVRHALGTERVELDIGSGTLLLSEAIEAVARTQPDVVCIGSSPAGGLVTAKLVCRQVRRRFPTLPILVVHWAGVSRDGRERLALSGAGASAVCGSIDELRLALIALRSAVNTNLAEATQPERLAVAS